MQPPIIILGMPRSGTSLLAEVVHRWGASAGPSADLLAADAWNPQGYWEYLPLKRFNDRLLASVGANERLPPASEQALRERATDPAFRAPAEQLLATMRQQATVWFWKDPRLPLLLPFWQAIWGEVTYLIPFRNPTATARSQQRMAAALLPTDQLPYSAAFLYWQRFMLPIITHTQAVAAKLFVEYEQLLAEPASQVARIAAFLDQRYQPPGEPAARQAQMAQTIAPALQRSHAPNFLDLPVVTREQRALYQLLRHKVYAPDAPVAAADVALYPGWHEYLGLLDALFQHAIAGLDASRNWHDLHPAG